jgi:hypothetical protein
MTLLKMDIMQLQVEMSQLKLIKQNCIGCGMKDIPYQKLQKY